MKIQELIHELSNYGGHLEVMVDLGPDYTDLVSVDTTTLPAGVFVILMPEQQCGDV